MHGVVWNRVSALVVAAAVCCVQAQPANQPAAQPATPGTPDRPDIEQAASESSVERSVQKSVVDGVTTWMISPQPGVTLRVREFGAGDPVLLLSGGPGFAGEQMMPIARIVDDGHRAIVLDQRGTGGSKVEPFTPESFSFAIAVADLEAVREAMELERWTLVGHSWGGLLSMAYAATHAERVQSMVLVSPAGVESSFWRSYRANLDERMTDEDRAAIAALPMPAQNEAEVSAYIRQMNRIMAPAMLANKDATAALHDEMSEENFNPLVSLVLQRELSFYDFRPALASLDSPVLVIQGDEDPIGLDVGRAVVDAMPNATRKIIEDCGHWPSLERPERLNELIASFLAEQ